MILVRPWVDPQAGNGCCSGDTRHPIALDLRDCGPVELPAATREFARAYRLLRETLPDVDVQIVAAGNTVFLVPEVIRSLRGAGSRGRFTELLRRTRQATRPGALLVDGVYVGEVSELGPDGVVAAVRERATAPPSP